MVVQEIPNLLAWVRFLHGLPILRDCYSKYTNYLETSEKSIPFMVL